jgi:hypothetical protein
VASLAIAESVRALQPDVLALGQTLVVTRSPDATWVPRPALEPPAGLDEAAVVAASDWNLNAVQVLSVHVGGHLHAIRALPSAKVRILRTRFA